MMHMLYKTKKTWASKTMLFFLISAFAVSPLMAVPVQAISGSDFNPGRIIDDHIFFDGNTMTAGDIQSFLNSKVPVCDTWGTQPYGGTTRAQYAASRGVSTPFICLKDYQLNTSARAADQYCQGALSGGTKSAAQIIKDVSVACSVSPKVIIILLQKEQSLITDDWPWPVQYEKATGYACPDTAPCDPEYAGLQNQLYYGARQYHRYAQQPELFGHRAGRTNFVRYHPNANCGGTNVFIQNQATAGLYNYTPYQPNAAALANLYGTGDGCSAYGNRNFWRMYTDWFGSSVSGVCYNGFAGVKTDVAFRKYDSKADSADFLVYSGSGSGCVESHIWNPGFTSWKDHIATNQPGVNFADTQILFGDLDGGMRDYPLLFGLQNTGSGKIESHVWAKNMKSFLAHAASNRATINPADAQIAVADLNGDGKDEPILVVYRNTGSGMIEFHGWGAGMQSWLYNIATNKPAVDPATTSVAFGDLDGDNDDEAILIAQSNTGSGKVEFHIWGPGLWSWQSHIASNLPAINLADNKIMMADVDGNGADEAVLVGLRNTGSGRIEFHVWNPGFGSWRSNTASNQPY